KLQVCDVCGAYLSRLDNDRRLADHFYGKMHLGYAQMRKTWEQLQKELKSRPPPLRDEAANGPGGPRGYDDAGYGDRGYGGRGGFRGGGGGFGGRGGGFRGRGGFGARW
ncbi:splicing factor, partial [Cryomyces antarcticus]